MEIPSQHRACAHCRSQKVRCLPDESNPDVCQRCSRTGRPCVFTPLQKRKQRKRTDTRVAELEREMRNMRSLLKEKNVKEMPGSSSGAGKKHALLEETSRVEGLWDKGFDDGPEPTLLLGADQSQQSGTEPISQLRGAAVETVQRPNAWKSRHGVPQSAPKADIVTRGLVSMSTARQLLEYYTTELYPHCPMVYISPTCTADELRATKPTLFLAVMAAASGIEDPDLSARLDKEVLQEYANRTVVNSEKSVELVQSLLVSAVWYQPPNKFGQLKYYEYIHMAATMAMDIGIGTRPSKERRSRFDTKSGSNNIHPSEDILNPDLSMSRRNHEEEAGTASLECRRAFISCYSICVGVAFSLRRPAMMRITSYTRDCIDYLEQNSQDNIGDRILVSWVRLIVLAEEISTSLAFEDPGGMASILEPTTQVIMKAFEKRLTEWRNAIPQVDYSPCLRMMYLTIRLWLHELALHIDHSPEDFKAPYQMGVIHPSSRTDIPIKSVVVSIIELVDSSHALMDVFLSLSAENARALPVFTFVRVSFATFVLAKLCLSASSKHSRLAGMIDRTSLKAEVYMDRTILHVRSIIGSNGCRVPAIFLALLFKLRQWCRHPEIIQQADAAGEPSDLWPEGPDGAQRTQTAFEAPRFVEQISSEETSPATGKGTVSGSGPTPANVVQTQADSYDSLVGEQAVEAARRQGLSGQDIHIPNSPAEPQTLMDFGDADLNGIIAQADSHGLQAAGGEQGIATQPEAMDMHMDPDFMSMWDSMDCLLSGDLTGLDDWSALGTDIGQLQDTDGWQAPMNESGWAQ